MDDHSNIREEVGETIGMSGRWYNIRHLTFVLRVRGRNSRPLVGYLRSFEFEAGSVGPCCFGSFIEHLKKEIIKKGVFKGLQLVRLPRFPGATFIPLGTSIPESRVI